MKRKFLAHYVKPISGDSAGSQDILARDAEEATRIGKQKASAKGFVLADVTGPDDEE